MRAGRLPALALAALFAATPGGALTPPATALAERMRAAGLVGVGPLAEDEPQLHGALPGDDGLTVLLFAGCGPGGEAARRAALVAIADLARTPRRHALEVALCPAGGSGPGAAHRAAELWLARHPEAADRDAVLAALHLEPGEDGGAGGVVPLRAAESRRGRRLPPAWLVHAVLSAGRAGGGGAPAIGDPRWPLAGQLLGRFGRPRAVTGAEPFLAAGVPALTLAGDGPPGGWPRLLAATARRLDALAGRPRADDVFVALGGRVWGRRDLYWAGLAVFAALVVGGLPGRWRGSGGGERRRRGRRYLPGFVLRMLFLALMLIVPVPALLLLAPASLLTLAPVGRRWAAGVLGGLAAAPTLLFAGYWAVQLVSGRVAIWPAQPVRLLLVVAGVALAIAAIGHRRSAESVAETG